MTNLPDIKLPILASKNRRHKNLTHAGKGGDTCRGSLDKELLLERFERASLAEDATRHLRVPLKIKLG